MNNDYVDFKFGDHWASEFNLLAVSNSDRHNPPIYGSVNPNTATLMGKKGVYKWKTQINEKIFNMHIAFDSVTIAQLNRIKQWLEPHQIKKLIFADEPYKYYWATLNAEPNFTFLPFVEGEKVVGERTIIEGVYKGEMEIPFLCIDNNGYSIEGTFENLENKSELAIVKGNHFTLVNADNDFIEDLKIKGNSIQKQKYNNTLSDTDFNKLRLRSVEKDWQSNNLATFNANNGEVTISAPYEYSGIAQEQRESIINHKYYASAEINTDSLDTALEVAGKNITNSIMGKDINITDGLIGKVDDLVVYGDTQQEEKKDNKINNSFLENLDNWDIVGNATVNTNKQNVVINAEQYEGIQQINEKIKKGNKYYFRGIINSNSADVGIEVPTETGTKIDKIIELNDSNNGVLNDFEIYGEAKQDTSEEIAPTTKIGKVITLKNVQRPNATIRVLGDTLMGGNYGDEVFNTRQGTGYIYQKNITNLINFSDFDLESAQSGRVQNGNEIVLTGPQSTTVVDKVYSGSLQRNLINIEPGKYYTFSTEISSGNDKFTTGSLKVKLNLKLETIEDNIIENYSRFFEIELTPSQQSGETTVYVPEGNNFTICELELITNNKIMVNSSDELHIRIKLEEGQTKTTMDYTQGTTKIFSLHIQQDMFKGDYFEKRLGNWYECHNIKKIQFNGSESWRLNLEQTNTVRFSLGVNALGIEGIEDCNHFMVRTTQAHGDYEYVNLSSNGATLYINILKQTLIDKYGDSTADSFKSYLEELYYYNDTNNARGLTICGIMRTKEALACTSSQIETLKQLTTSTLTTPITTFKNFYSKLRLEVTYNGIPAAPSIYNPSPVIGVGNSGNFKIQMDNNKPTISSAYEIKTYTVNIPRPLMKLGDAQDRIEKDNGQWKLIRYTNSKKFTGNEEVTSSMIAGEGYYGYYINIGSLKSTGERIGLCTHFKQKLELENNIQEECFLFDYSDITYGRVIFITKEFKTIEEFKYWLSTAEMTLYYPTSVGMVSYLTDETQTILSNLKTYRPQTFIRSTDSLLPTMKVEYNKQPTVQTKLSTVNTNTNLSMIFEPTLDETPIGITNLGISTATINFNKPLLVNLTEEYGAGNEPTKEWCDQNLDYNDFAEGGAPSMKTPKRIKVVGGNINLFNPITHLPSELDGKYYGSSGTLYSSSSYRSAKMPVFGNTQYTLSTNTHTYSVIPGYIDFWDKDFNFMWSVSYSSNKTFTTPNNCRFITFPIVKERYEWIKLEYGPIATQKSSYNLANIDTKITGYNEIYRSFPLAQVQVLRKGDYLTKDGIHHTRKIAILDGTEDWSISANKGFAISKFMNSVKKPVNNDTYAVRSNYFKSETAFHCVNNGCKNGISFNTYGELWIRHEDLNTVSELKTFLAKCNTEGNPVIIEYELAQEEKENYTTAQKEWYNNFEIYRKNTQITTNAEVKPSYSFTYDINDTYAVYSTKTNQYEKLGLIFNNLETIPRFIVNNTGDNSSIIKMRKPLVVDLTNEFGVGNEPTLEWCQTNINFDNCCEYGSPSPHTESPLISIGDEPIRIDNKSRNLIAQQNILNWNKDYCTVEKLNEKYNNRNVFRVKFENHKLGEIKCSIPRIDNNLVFSLYVRYIQGDNNTDNSIGIRAKTTGGSERVQKKLISSNIGEWQRFYVPISKSFLTVDVSTIELFLKHQIDTDDSTIIDICMPQLEEGFTPHDYIVYAPTIVNNLIFPEPLRGLQNGVKDEFSKSGIIRRIGVFTITKDTGLYSASFNLNKNYLTIEGTTGIYVRGDGDAIKVPFYCNRFKDCTSLNQINSSRTIEGIGITDSKFKLCLRADLIGVVNTDTTSDIYRKFRTWVQENPIIIYYEKEVADEEPLTELQKNTLDILITRKESNEWLVSGILDPEIELTYKLNSSVKEIHPWVTGSNLLDKTWLYNDNDIHTKPYIEVETGDATKSGISATRPIYLLNSGTTTANLNLKFDYINIVSPLTIVVSCGKFDDTGFKEEKQVSYITINPFTNYQPFQEIYDNNPNNWYIEIDSELGEVYLKHRTDKDKVLNLNRFNKDHTFLTLIDCNFVDYDKVFPTLISEIEETAIENTIFNKVSVASAPEAYRLKNAEIDWKHTYL